MPRRKQGHSKESATGGYLKKKTDPGIVLIQNESFKHLPTSNDLVFKIKKSSITPLPTSNEKIEREHIEASKSLIDFNMVSQHEVNNNLVKNGQDESKLNQNETKNFYGADPPGNGEEFSEEGSGNGSPEATTVSNVFVNNSVFVIAKRNEREKQSMSSLQNVPSLQESVIKENRNQSPTTVITRSISVSVTSLDSSKGNSHVENTDKVSIETEKQNVEMSGLIPTVTCKERLFNKTESQQMNYRISASENRSNHLKDAANPVFEQNCQLPSSVYGTPASSIEKVLMGLQVPEKDCQNNNLTGMGKISFLQEILEKKSSKIPTSESVASHSEDKSKLQQIKTSSRNELLVSSVSNLTTKQPAIGDKDQNRTENNTTQTKLLKLHIPDGLSNDDSDSSVFSTESCKASKFPKITSPQILGQHISKIISKNAAIVETLDPIWSRRFFKQTSQSNALNNEGDSKKSGVKTNRVTEDKNVIFSSFDGSNKSKLHSALLGGSEGEFLNANQNVQLTSPSIPSAKERNFSQFNNLLTTVPSGNVYSKIVCSVSEDELKGSDIKSLLNFKQGKYSKHKKSNLCFDKDLYSQHPQNPEGSIIKDLLLKSKSQEELKLESEMEDKESVVYNTGFSASDMINLNNQFEKQTSVFKCSQCSLEFSNKYNLDRHLTFCNAANPLLSLRDSTEKFRFKEISAQSKPLSSLNFRYKTKEQTWECFSKNDATENANDGVGQILKKHLLLPRSPPMKRRKVSDSMFGESFSIDQSSDSLHDKNDIKDFPPKIFNNLEMSPHRSRSQSVHLFGGEVHVLDGSKTKKIKIKTTLPGAFSMFTNKVSNNLKKSKPSDNLEVEKDTSSLSGVIVTIAQPVHNSGGTVHLPTRKVTSSPVVAISPNISDGIPKYSKMETSPTFNFLKSNQLGLYKSPSDQREHTVQNLSYPYDFLPEPDFKAFTTSQNTSSTFKMSEFMPGSTVDELSPVTLKVTLSPGSKPFYSPIFSSDEKSFELPVTAGSQDKLCTSHPIVPTVLFTPSSPTMPSTDNENVLPPVTSISEPTKKFLTPTRPNSLPLKKKPFTMVSSTLVSPETPRPKKNCRQLYFNGHAYTFLGLKCSTRSTYCSLHKRLPMFVPQEADPKLSMYNTWQYKPAMEELSGYTPGQMMSLYCSKQKSLKSITVNSKLGEPLIFTHSSYWTYRSQDHPEKRKTSSSYSDSSLEPSKDLLSPSESAQDLLQGENSRSESIISSFGNKPDKAIHFTDDSSLQVDTENTCSDGEAINSNDEDEDDDDDCQDDGTESLTDSSQPQPPKRVKIFEGGFKSNEDYTYVRGRGRGKYVCEECGIRCKKPSMLKKHIRTHTDLRPYKCRHCSFAFKTKGNLTKHMKSKAHHKKCTELGIIPVPTTTDDSQIDEEALAKQIEKKKTQFSDGEDADDDEDEDSDESDDECESDTSSMIASNQANRMLANGHSGKSDSQEKLNADSFDETLTANEASTQQTLEQQAVISLLDLRGLGEPSQWSTSTGNLTDVTSSGETEDGSLAIRTDQSLLPTSQFTSCIMSGSALSSRVKNLSDQWLSTETLGHRPRSYSADIPQSSGKDSLAKYKYLRSMPSANPEETPVDELTEFGGREPYTRRYSISVAREARKPHVLHNPEWVRTSTNPQKWLEGETSDQPMDLSITRDLSKCKSLYTAGLPGSLINMVTQEENLPEANLSPSLDAFGEPYQLKSLPVLSPQVLVDYETSCDNISTEASLLPLTDEQAAFGPGTQRSLYYVQDSPTEDISDTKDAEATEDPPSPDIADYAVCSPVSPPTLEDSSYYYSQENMSQANAEEASPSSRFRAEFIVPTSSSSGMEEGKCICRICNKMFAKSSHLRLHVNIHYFERPFRCDNCAVSFRTKGHLQKHKRSVSHYNKVNMNLTFGTPTVDNPRPFKCADCKIAFRIHGHLAKHLRSKMHIMKLECLGKLPFGMYAEMERSGISLNEIDTTDCNNSLESLQVMAQKLYQRDPRRMRWQGPEQISDTGCVIPAAPSTTTLIDSMLPISEPLTTSFDSGCASVTIPGPTLASSVQSDNDEKPDLSETDALRMASVFPDSGSSILPLPRYIASQPATSSSQEPIQQLESAESDSAVSLHRSCTCHLCGRLFKSAKFLQVHLYCDHSNWNPSSVGEATSSSSPISSVVSSQESVCDLCGKQFPNQKTLQQHLLSHAQPRPFVCELCDAGFTSSSSLVAHKATHQNNSSASTENSSVQLK